MSLASFLFQFLFGWLLIVTEGSCVLHMVAGEQLQLSSEHRKTEAQGQSWCLPERPVTKLNLSHHSTEGGKLGSVYPDSRDLMYFL
jgi:hypothetical protein